MVLLPNMKRIFTPSAQLLLIFTRKLIYSRFLLVDLEKITHNGFTRKLYAAVYSGPKPCIYIRGQYVFCMLAELSTSHPSIRSGRMLNLRCRGSSPSITERKSSKADLPRNCFGCFGMHRETPNPARAASLVSSHRLLKGTTCLM